VLPSSRADLPADWPTLPSNEALEHLTGLTSLGIQVGSKSHRGHKRCQSTAQSPGRRLLQLGTGCAGPTMRSSSPSCRLVRRWLG
jgi:hypothetical protein